LILLNEKIKKNQQLELHQVCFKKFKEFNKNIENI
jgi:hypothetical protein